MVLGKAGQLSSLLCRLEAKQVLLAGRHGDFLVRDSTQPGEYTLVVRQKEKVVNIRILRGPGGYGVEADHCSYPGVAHLIQRLQDQPGLLQQTFPHVQLRQCASKPGVDLPNETTAELLSRLLLKNRDMVLQQNFYSSCINHRKQLTESFQQHKTRRTALKAVRSLFKDQLDLQSAAIARDLMQAGGKVGCQHPGLEHNRDELDMRLDRMRGELQQSKAELRALKVTLFQQLSEMQQFKPLLSQLQQEVTLLRLYVESRGNVDKNYLELLLRENDSEDASQYDSRQWSVPCDRATAERLLLDQVPGTFLVRPTTTRGLAVSVACDMDDKTEVRHCLIHQSPDTGRFGFNTEYCIFSSLDELVMKHRVISLKFYNRSLDVCLTYPVNYCSTQPTDD